jgi:hypothetical protein
MFKTTLARIGALLIDLSGQKAVILGPDDAGLILRNGDILPLLPDFDPTIDVPDAAVARALLTMGLANQLLTISSNPTIGDSLMDAGLQMQIPFERLDDTVRVLTGQAPRPQSQPLLGVIERGHIQ